MFIKKNKFYIYKYISMKFNLKKLKKLLNKKNIMYGLAFCGIIALLAFLAKIREEGFENTSDGRMLILVKDNSKNLDHHHLNISKIRVIDYENKEIPLTFHSTSDEWKKDDYKSALDNNSKTFFHSGYTDKHLYYHGTDYKGHMKRFPKWLSFTFPSDKDIKYIHIESRSGYENRIENVKLYVYRGKLDKFWKFSDGSTQPKIKDFSGASQTIIDATLKRKKHNYIMSDRLINEKSAYALREFSRFDENDIPTTIDDLKKASNSLNNMYANASKARFWKPEDSPINNADAKLLTLTEAHIFNDKNEDKLKTMKMIIEKLNKKQNEINELKSKISEAKTITDLTNIETKDDTIIKEIEEKKAKIKKQAQEAAQAKAKLFLGIIVALIVGGGIFFFMRKKPQVPVVQIPQS